jgi:hypothetical protein
VSSPPATELLTAWERGRSQAPVERGLTLLAVAIPGASADALARVPIGRRDGELLNLHRRLFGSRLAGIGDCPSCRERLELGFTVEDVEAASETAPPEGFGRQVGGYRLRFRLPDSLDLLYATGEESDDTARGLLLERCLLAAHRDGKDHGAAELPVAIVDGLVSAMAEVDRQADVRLALCCPACGTRWEASFDIVAFLWRELAAWAERTLLEVHALASAYGWSEADLLAMHPERRRRYLELVGA